jgi:WD40 repeat protein
LNVAGRREKFGDVSRLDAATEALEDSIPQPMAEESDKKPIPAVDKTGEFFNVGAPLHAVRPGYIRRPADDMLYNSLVAGQFAHVIAPDRTGKTSLIAATSARLQNNGFKVASLDLEQIGERDGGTDAGRWYYSIAYRLSRQLRLKTDLQAWWQDHTILSNRQRLVEFYAQLILQNIQERVVVFVDEIQVIGELSFAEHLLASIRAAHNARATEPEFNRLSFVMIGECDPHSLAGDPQVSPFSVSTEVRLNDFTREDLNIFAAELNQPVADAERALDRVFHWTSGQPYLSQKLARAIAREDIDDDIDDVVDRLAMHQLAGRAAISSEPHMSHVHRAVMSDRKNYEAMLTTYGQVRKGMRIEYDPDSARHRQLLALGLVVTDDDGTFRIRNRVYESVFTASWANENLPLHWRGPAIAAAIVIALTAIPFAYTQLLPKPYLRIMSTATIDLDTVTDAYQNLRSFPGHDESADRMFQTVLENRARQATDRNEIRDIIRYAAILPGGPDIVEAMQADFWDRRAVDAMRSEQRDDALLASIESLSDSSQARRRRAASLVGDDYPALLATVPVQQADNIVFNADSGQLSYINGADVSQWSATGDAVEARESWTISALEVTPLVRRVIIDREGTASRIGLTVNVSHPRLDDIRMRLIAPSGRAAELTFSQPSSAANEEIRIGSGQLEPLMGESLTGTWSLTLRDEATGVTGHLMHWNLSLNSQVVVETFERGLDIPDPVERESENLWISGDGRYAIARALQSDSARLWDLNFAQAARTIAVPANQRVLGLSTGAEFLVTMTQSTVTLWRTTDGRRANVFELGASVASTMLSADGQYLVVTYQSDPDTFFEVWSLRDGEVVAELDVAGDPALFSIDASASHLAVADYDRAIRIWDIREGEQKAQFDLEFQPGRIELSRDGQALGVVLAGQGVALWRTDAPDAPVFEDSGPGEWQMAFSPSGARFVAGNHEEGMQTYRTADGLATGPLLDPGLAVATDRLFAFSADENLLVTAGVGDISRFWSLPTGAADAGQETDPSADADVWRDSGSARSAIAPGGERIAFGDRSGHVHIELVDGSSDSGVRDNEEISFLGHQGAVTSLAFSDDAALVASTGADGTVRIWDAHSGLPRPFYGRSSVTNVVNMEFSPSAKMLAVFGTQRVWLMDTESGAEIATVDLGEAHHDMAFASDQAIYVGGESGTLRSVYRDRTGNWHLRNEWRGERPIRHIEVAARQIVLVDAQNQVHLLDPASGQVSAGVFVLPSTVRDVAFSPNETRVLFRTGRWIHRALVTPTGLVWTDSVRSPKPMSGSRMAFDTSPPENGRATNLSADRVLILARDSGVTELAELHFNFGQGPALFGSRSELLEAWSERLRGPRPSVFAREGF